MPCGKSNPLQEFCKSPEGLWAQAFVYFLESWFLILHLQNVKTELKLSSFASSKKTKPTNQQQKPHYTQICTHTQTHKHKHTALGRDVWQFILDQTTETSDLCPSRHLNFHLLLAHFPLALSTLLLDFPWNSKFHSLYHREQVISPYFLITNLHSQTQKDSAFYLIETTLFNSQLRLFFLNTFSVIQT